MNAIDLLAYIWGGLYVAVILVLVGLCIILWSGSCK